MFLLNNIYDRPYLRIYPNIPRVVFDISDEQLKSTKNRDWFDIVPGSIVCVVNSTRKVSTFHRIEANTRTDITEESGHQHVITGTVVGKLARDFDMTALLNKYRVRHEYLPRNQFSIGFNVANLGNALDSLVVKSKLGNSTIADLKLLA